VRRAPAVGALALALLAPPEASAFVRSTTSQPGQGLCLWWSARTIPYRVNVGALAGQGCASPAEASGLLQASLAAWGAARRAGAASPCTDLALAYAGETTSTEVGYSASGPNTNLVVARSGSCADPAIVPAADACHATPGACANLFNCWDHGSPAMGAGAIATTTTTYAVRTGEIIDADIELYGWDGNAWAAQDGSAGYYLTCGGPADSTCSDPPYGQSACNWVDIGNTATHEAGHLIGLGHVCVAGGPPPSDACPSPPSVMEPTARFGETSKRVLAPDDVEAVCTIYPAGAATLTCLPPPAARSHGGCAGGDAGAASLLLAAAWLLRRRR
jgi:hypothetical protein